MKFCRNCGTGLQSAQIGAMGGMPPPMSAPIPMATPMGPMGPMAMPGSGPAPLPPGASNLGASPLVPPPGAPMRAPMGSTITCPRCSTQTPLGFAYCQQCGLHLPPQASSDAGPPRGPMGAPPGPPLGGPPGPPLGGPLGGPLGAPIDPQGATLAAPDMRPSVPGLPPPPSGPRAVVGPGSVAGPGPLSAPRPAADAGPAWGSAVLVNRDGSDGQRFPFTSDGVVVGRAGADIAFDEDRFLAKQHARLERQPDGCRVTSLDSLNGVFRKATEPVELADGAVVLVGREVLRFERVSVEERTSTPLVRHGVALFGSPPREPWGRLCQLIPSGGYRDVRHLIADEVVLGREEGDIVFRDDAFMSRRHAAITWDGRTAKLTDLGSSNGSFVRITGPVLLRNGDHIRMGDQLLRIELGR